MNGEASSHKVDFFYTTIVMRDWKTFTHESSLSVFIRIKERKCFFFVFVVSCLHMILHF